MIEYGLNTDLADKIFRLLLWYGFFGIKIDLENEKYIYDLNYNMPLMEGIIKKAGTSVLYTINQAFWPCLIIKGP